MAKKTKETLNRDWLVREIAKATEMSITDVERVMAAFKEVVATVIETRRRLLWTGFMEVEGEHVEDGIKKNPKTKEEVKVPCHTKAKIKFGTAFKKSVR